MVRVSVVSGSWVAPNWNRVDLSWVDNADNEQGFKVERLVGGGNWEQIALLGANVTSVIDLAVTGATTYSYRVRAYNNGGDLANSNTASVTTPNPPPPTAPSNLVATAISSSQIKLDWTDTSNVETTFTVQRAPGGTTNWTTVTTLGPNTTTWTNGGLTPETTYSYRVNASNVGGASAWSNVASATTLVQPSVGVPGFCSAYPTSSTSIRIYWNQAANATSYRVYRSLTDNPVQSGTVVATVSARTGTYNWYDDANLVSGQRYHYQVTSMLSGTESGPSNEDEQIPVAGGLPLHQSDAAIKAAAQNLSGDPNAIVLTPSNTIMEPSEPTISNPTRFEWETGLMVQASTGPEKKVPLFEDWFFRGWNHTLNARPEGAYRKIEIRDFFADNINGAQAEFILPVVNGQNYNVGQFSDGSPLSSPHVYLGLETNGYGVDAGIAYNTAEGSHSNRWSPILRIADGRNSQYIQDSEVKVYQPTLPKLKYLPMAAGDAGYARISYVLNRATRVVTFRVLLFRIRAGVSSFLTATTLMANAPSNLRIRDVPIDQPRAKLIVALAQKHRAAVATVFSEKPPFQNWPNAFWADGTYVKGIGVTNEVLIDGSGEESWRDYWNSKPDPFNRIFTPAPQVTVVSIGGSAPTDSVSIQH